MGLQKDITLDSGVYLPEAYIHIISCNYICNVHVAVKVCIYKDYNAYKDNKNEVASFTHVCTDDFNTFFSISILNTENINIIGQSYEWLKTLDFYKDAIYAPKPK